MPGSEESRQQRRNEILLSFPWVDERDRLMVVGADLDALFSALLLHHFRGWTIAGVYNFRSIYMADGYDLEDVLDAVWVDLDIAKARVKSVGHHILTQQADHVPPGLTNCLNPNLLRGVSKGKFKAKYPLATIHLLMWLLGVAPPRKKDDKYLFWLPDSCWITAQGKYAENMRDWLLRWMDVPFLTQTMADCNTETYEQGMMEFLSRFSKQVPIKQGKGQTISKFLGLHGYQCRFGDMASDYGVVERALKGLGRFTGWSVPPLPAKWRTVAGVRNYHESNLSKFLEKNNVFSYVFPNRGVFNYTVFDEID